MFAHWDLWKRSFDVWEQATARYLEQWLKSPLMLNGSGAMLTAIMKMRAASEKAKAQVWSEMGLPTKRDQERTLHLLNQIQSRLLDLEERLEAQEPRG
jgi:hypothetical protein